jgi:hypothetical protein
LAGFHRGPGSAFLQDVWFNLRAARFALFIVTDDFVASRWCMYEVGVASALRIPSVPLLTPGYDFENFGLPVNEFRGGALTDPVFLRELADELAADSAPASPNAVVTIASKLRRRSRKNSQLPPLRD